ncbi:MAG: Re/Si-specific NAD(P)(+) transhydrogenase subunit alpha [Nitrospiria bacterium]
MKIGIPKEIIPQERRVALVPESIKRVLKKGFEVVVETGAGEFALVPDSEYEKAGAKVLPSPEALYNDAEVILKVQRPVFNTKLNKDEVDLIKEGSVLIAFLQPINYLDLIKKIAARNITSFSMDAIPRTTLAQSMDALSSMATVAGYKAVITAANAIGKFFPMFMTAAGTIAPARVLILGAGVAGLQAIATAKRLGGVVEVFDTRPACKEQVESLGVKFIELDVKHEEAQDAGGYAKQLSEDVINQEKELIRKHIIAADVVITTAQVYGKKAPILITEAMVKEMKKGSCIVDLAVEQGGNCELSEPGKEVVKHGVIINGYMNIPSSMPVHASQMYSRNLEKFLFHLTNEKGFKMDMNDEITRGSIITHKGEILYGKVKEAIVAK